MLNDIQRAVILLIKAAITGEPATLPQEIDFNKICKLAGKHQIAPIVYYGAVNSKIAMPKEFEENLFWTTCQYISLGERQRFEYEKVIQAFEANGIDYMPLKGIILKDLFPKPEMRAMSDIDVLIRLSQKEQLPQIMQGLGFEEITESNHELIWDKKGALNIELHKRLIPSYNKDYYAYYGDGWELAKKSEGDNCKYELSPEDQLIYLFTHFSKHYRDGGIGIKHIVDLWAYIRTVKTLDNNYIKKELKKLQLFTFYENISRVIDVWFNDKESDTMTDFITEFVFSSGAYGTASGHTISEMVKNTKSVGTVEKTRKLQIVYLFFLPYSDMCGRYPFLKKAPVLLPFMWIVRWISTIFFHSGRIKERKEKIEVASVDNVKNYQKALNYVGLDFNFKE